MIVFSSSIFGCSTVPSITGTFGPYTSASSRPTEAPMFFSAMARLTATVVLPTPPLPLATAIRFFTPGMGALSGIFSSLLNDKGRGDWRQVWGSFAADAAGPAEDRALRFERGNTSSDLDCFLLVFWGASD